VKVVSLSLGLMSLDLSLSFGENSFSPSDPMTFALPPMLLMFDTLRKEIFDPLMSLT
jgi:hypothetical protein